MAKDHVSKDRAKLAYVDAQGKPGALELLWGDEVDVQSVQGSQATVLARGRTGTVAAADLGGAPLLELYFIDVGQGDGVLIRTPDGRHVLIDGGYARSRQPTGKNAADFVDWKFAKDYRRQRIHLDALVASHCDSDHYGGLWDLISMDERARRELDCEGVDVDVLYHAGVSWWRKPGGGRWLGPIEEVGGEKYLTQLLEGRAEVERALDPASGAPQLQGEWADFLAAVLATGCDIRRLSQRDGFLPGFEPAQGTASIRVLAPVAQDDVVGAPALRSYTSSTSQNTNGHSLLLRVDYGRARVLLTGDLNKRSMHALLEDLEQPAELACDVVKGCHHGSEDVSYAFLQAMRPSATVISSGDNEGHAHPRPAIVAASATTGHLTLEDDELRTPLVYSTEISRSIDVGRLLRVRDEDHAGAAIVLEPSDRAALDYEVVAAGDLNPKQVSARFHGGTRVVHGVTYGLVNVRTDGERILCATLNEKEDRWEIESFAARF